MASILPLPPQPRRVRARENGGVAIIVALVLAVLLGFGGIVLDLGQLFVNKTELQNAADACALAAAGQLGCDPAGGACPASFLADAEAAGTFVGARNASNFQKGAVTIAPADIRFHTAIGPNTSYLSRAAGANPNSRFAMCIARSASFGARFMRVLGMSGPAVVQAAAVATLAPGQTACNGPPIGVCSKNATPPNYGYGTIGEWITGTFNNASNDDNASLTGSFRWVSFNSADRLRDQLMGNSAVCNIQVGDGVAVLGTKQGTKMGWNTHFGIYPNGANAESPLDAPPDKTGYAYPSKAPGVVINVGQSAYADYRTKQAAHAPFDSKSYAPSGAAGNVNGNQISQADHLALGQERRLVAVPVVDCASSAAKPPILAMGCVLMLNPMSNGSSGDIYLEWRGLASTAGSPCRSAGVPGGTTGPLVPTLVQ